jgi:hypothetical protein
MATKEAIVKAIGTLQALGVQSGPERGNPAALRLVVEVWAKVLEPLTDAQLESCVVAWVAQPTDAGRWWPTPGNLLAIEPTRQLAAIDDSAEAWGRILKHAAGGLFGRYSSQRLTLTHAEQAGVDACGGGNAIGESTYDQHSWMQAQFRRAYQSAKQTGEVLQRHPQLTDGEARGLLTQVDRNTRGES